MLFVIGLRELDSEIVRELGKKEGKWISRIKN